MVLQKIPSFDPNPSLKAAIKFLKEIGVQNFALIGRIATWVYLPSDLHQFTKYIDLAVLSTDSAQIEKDLTLKGLKVYHLPIGGVAVREGDLIVDFIDHRLDGLDLLFREAIENARRDVEILGEIIGK